MTFRDFLASHWGDVASLAGLALTIWAVFKAKKAAEQARDIAQQVKKQIASLDTLAAVSAGAGRHGLQWRKGARDRPRAALHSYRCVRCPPANCHVSDTANNGLVVASPLN
jgi:hypothetical protein